MEKIDAFKAYEIEPSYYLMAGGAAETSTTTTCTVDSGGSSDCKQVVTEDDCEGNVISTTETWSDGPCF